MVVIPQHGSNGETFDVACFLTDIDLFAKPDSWHITVYWCSGDRALEIEKMTASGLSLPDSEFRVLYGGICQTIEGDFIGMASGARLFELIAVDSSYWEVTGPSLLEAHMLSKYGAWQRA